MPVTICLLKTWSIEPRPPPLPIATCTTFNDPFLWCWVIQLNAPRAVLMSYAAAATAHHADHNPSRIYDSFAISSDRQDNLRTRNVWLAELSPSQQDFLLRRKGRFSIKRLLPLKKRRYSQFGLLCLELGRLAAARRGLLRYAL